MPDNSSPTYAVLHLRFKLQVPTDVLLAQSREAAKAIASVEGLIWKIWLVEEQMSEIGGVYLFASREAAVSYLNHPVIHALCSNPAVIRTDSQIWDVESSLSAITQAPLPEIQQQFSQPEAAMAGGR
jgi:hypothetical protein